MSTIEFQNAMRNSGISPPLAIQADGTIHRFHVAGDSSRSENGWYVLHSEPFAGAFGCWKRGISELWSQKSYQSLTDDEKAQHRANMETLKRQREETQTKIHTECRVQSLHIWNQSKQGPCDHSYTIKKGLSSSHGARLYKGSLIVPVRDANGTLHGLQFISPDGEKRFNSGTDKTGHYFSIGGKPGSVLYLAEGFATAATIHEATNQSVAVCFDCGNLSPVATSLRAKFPDIQIVVCADNDTCTDGNPGLTKATEAALTVGGLLAVPVFPAGTEGTDFNDLAAVAGVDEVRRQLLAALITTTSEKSQQIRVVEIADFLSLKFPPRQTILNPWLPAQGLGMVYAPRGIGKTHFSIGVAYAVASGGTFLHWTADKPRGVLFIDGEMPGNVLQERISAIAVSNDLEPVEPLRIITPDLQPNGSMLNLSDPADQRLIEPFLEGISLIIVDNLSTLCRSGKEAEGESWLPVQQWALQQRASGRSVLFIHHAGKNGEQRGTSRREDVLDTVIALKRPSDYTPDQGACFEIHFEKARGLYGDDTKPFETRLTTDDCGRQIWTMKPLEESTAEKVAGLLNDGVPQNEIAEMLGITKGAVSKAKKRAQLNGLLMVS